MSYLNRPRGMAGVTLVEAFHELLCKKGKHVSASAAVPGIAANGQLKDHVLALPVRRLPLLLEGNC
jgi:hypothetical protein